jgi:hypothetical protein
VPHQLAVVAIGPRVGFSRASQAMEERPLLQRPFLPSIARITA